MKQKIFSLQELGDHLSSVRANKNVVQCHGVFDLLHLGHIRHFEEAKKLGDILVVSLTADAYVNKGPNRPAFPEAQRAEAIAALEAVDYVVINEAPSAIPAIETIRPTFYVKGQDYKMRPQGSGEKLALEEAAVRKHGGSLVYTDDIQFSSSHLLNKHFPRFTPDVDEYLEDFRSKYSLDQVLGYFEAVKKQKVLVIGETIIDEYHYVEAIGKAGKEPVLVTQSLSSERFAGGVLSIANHIAGFSDEVGLLSCLGSIDSCEAFVRERLLKNISPTFILQKDKPTIVKLRYIEKNVLQKLFEVYFMKDEVPPPSEEKELLDVMEKLVPQYDVVVVADYGHGMIKQHAVELLCQRAKFLAVNTQVNAGNRGFHTISRYPRADYVCMSDGELRLDLRDRDTHIRDLMLHANGRGEYGTMTITRGTHGMISYNKETGFHEGPAFTRTFVDRIGSGDAVLSLTAPLAAAGAPLDVLTFIGNLAGAEAVKTLGHRSNISFSELKKIVTSLLK